MKKTIRAMLLATFLSPVLAFAGVDSGFPGKGRQAEEIFIPRLLLQNLINNAVVNNELLVSLPGYSDEQLEAVGIDLRSRAMVLRSLNRQDTLILLREEESLVNEP